MWSRDRGNKKSETSLQVMQSSLSSVSNSTPLLVSVTSVSTAHFRFYAMTKAQESTQATASGDRDSNVDAVSSSGKISARTSLTLGAATSAAAQLDPAVYKDDVTFDDSTPASRISASGSAALSTLSASYRSNSSGSTPRSSLTSVIHPSRRKTNSTSDFTIDKLNFKRMQ